MGRAASSSRRPDSVGAAQVRHGHHAQVMDGMFLREQQRHDVGVQQAGQGEVFVAVARPHLEDDEPVGQGGRRPRRRRP